uniref:Reverse transcriptase domain-containing protein n=1 Tax=Rhodnius prolixus TaxID=13249 RepID=T1HB78_RHOPR
MSGISWSSIQRILSKNLFMRRVATKLVHRILTDFSGTVPLAKSWEALHNVGVKRYLIRAIQGLYQNASGAVKVGGRIAASFPVNKGLKQGCCLSPLLFNIYVEQALKDPAAKWVYLLVISLSTPSNKLMTRIHFGEWIGKFPFVLLHGIKELARHRAAKYTKECKLGI